MCSFATHASSIVAVVLFGSTANIQAQSIAAPNTSQGGVVLTKLWQPVYPPIARQARISGDVDLKIEVREDGSVESIVVASGHPMLKQAALDSAQQSQFVCRGCSEVLTSYTLVYTFQLATDQTPEVRSNQEPQPTHVFQSQNHVTVVAEPTLIDHGVDTYIRVRSAKCLYLWRCGYR
jgi:TonB family protein